MVPATLIAAAALQLGMIIKKIWQDPGCIQRSVTHLKENFTHTFHQRTGDTREAFIKRLAIFTIKTLLITAFVIAPFVVFPPSFAIPLALTLSFYVGKFLFNLEGVKDYFKQKKMAIIDAFTRREGEENPAFYKRLAINMGKAVLITAALAVVVYTGAVFIPSAIHVVGAGGFDLPSLLPFQCTPVVFLEYLTVGALHAKEAIQAYKRGEKIKALFHIVSAGASIFFPIDYFTHPNSLGMRLHHSFMGLALQLAPWRPVKVFGTAVAFDSFLSTFSPLRGGIEAINIGNWHLRNFVSYDYMNTVVENLSMLLNGLVGLSLVQELVKLIPRKKEVIRVNGEVSNPLGNSPLIPQ